MLPASDRPRFGLGTLHWFMLGAGVLSAVLAEPLRKILGREGMFAELVFGLVVLGAASLLAIAVLAACRVVGGECPRYARRRNPFRL